MIQTAFISYFFYFYKHALFLQHLIKKYDYYPATSLPVLLLLLCFLSVSSHLSIFYRESVYFYMYDEWCMCSSKTYLIFFLRDSFFCYSSVKLAVVVEKKKSKKKTDCTDQELSRKNTFFLGTCVYKLLCRTDRQKHLQLVWWNTLNCTALFFSFWSACHLIIALLRLLLLLLRLLPERLPLSKQTHTFTHTYKQAHKNVTWYRFFTVPRGKVRCCHSQKCI